jgi:hypothetical protein
MKPLARPQPLHTIPLELRRKIYEALKDDVSIKDTTKVNEVATVNNEDGTNFTVVLTSPESIHLLFRVDQVDIETKKVLGEVVLVAGIPRDRLDTLLENPHGETQAKNE